MTRHCKVLVLFGAVCLLLAGCGTGAPTAAPAVTAGPTLGVLLEATPTGGGAVVNGAGDAAVITVNRPGGTTKVKVGDTLEVRIATIPSGAATWQPTDLDTSILQQLGEPVYTRDTSPNSAGGIVSIKFKVVGPGTTPLVLLYVTPAQGNAPSLFSKSFGITVEATK
jgi:hypothetical protein